MARKTRAVMVAQEKRIFDLYVSGVPINEIAAELNLEYRTVQQTLKRIVNQIDVTKNLEIEMARDLAAIEQLFKTFFPMAIGGTIRGGPNDGAVLEPSLDHAEFIVKLLDRKSKLLGLDANKRVDVYHIIESWAEREGLDPQDVIEVVATLLPEPTQNSR